MCDWGLESVVTFGCLMPGLNTSSVMSPLSENSDVSDLPKSAWWVRTRITAWSDSQVTCSHCQQEENRCTVRWQGIHQRGSFMDVKIGAFTEVQKTHSYNSLQEQSVLSLAAGRPDWEELAVRLQEKWLKSELRRKYLRMHLAVYKAVCLQNSGF